MTRAEYDDLQSRMSRKIDRSPPGVTGKRKEGYDEAMLAAKSILADWYHSQCDNGKEESQ